MAESKLGEIPFSAPIVGDEGPLPPRSAEPPRSQDRGPAHEPDEWRWPPLTFAKGELPEISPEDAYAYGHYDGATGSSPEHYNLFVHWTLEEQRLRAAAKEAEARLQSATARQLYFRDLRSSIARRIAVQRDAEAAAMQFQARVNRLDEQLGEARDQEKTQSSRASLGSGILYTAVAVSFILAEIVIAQHIVADSLRLNAVLQLGSLVVQESWLFALGLGMVSVLLKPAYERLVEDQYWEGKDRGRLTAVMVGTSAFALITLFVLGAFRAEGFQTQAQTAELQSQNLPAAELAQRLDAIAATELASPLGQWATVLSGLLFAISGAICLSIGTRYFRVRRLLPELQERRRALERERATAESKRQETLNQATSEAAELHRMMTDLDHPPAPEALTQDVDEARKIHDDYLLKLREAVQKKSEYAYMDGYSRSFLGEPEPRDMHQRRPLEALRRALKIQALREALPRS